MSDESEIPEVVSQPAAAPISAYDPEVTRRILDTSLRYERMPGGEHIQRMATQLRLAAKEIESFAPRLDSAQLETLKVQRELDVANRDCRLLREDVSRLRVDLKFAQPAIAKVPAPLKPERKKPGPKAKNVMELPPQPQAKTAP